MIRQLCTSVCLALVSAAIPLRAANRPHAGTDSQKSRVWTNEDLEKLHALGLVSIVGKVDQEASVPQYAPGDYETTRDRRWYAERAAKLRGELERRQARLDEYRQAIEDTRSLKTMAAGINRDEGGIGITPEAGIEILQQRVKEAQAELDDLEDLARRNEIEPGTLRGE